MVDFDVTVEIDWLAKQKDSVNCWDTKVVFDLDKEIGLERQDYIFINYPTGHLEANDVERSTVLPNIYGRCREGSLTIRPSPYSQRVHRCFFPITYTDCCFRIERLSFSKSTCNFNNIN